MEVVGHIHMRMLEVSYELVDFNLVNLNRRQSKFFRFVIRKLLLPQGEQVQHTLPNHPESRVADRSLEMSQDGRQNKRDLAATKIFTLYTFLLNNTAKLRNQIKNTYFSWCTICSCTTEAPRTPFHRVIKSL